MKVTRTLNQIYSEFVQLRSRKEVVAQMALQARLDGRTETFEKLMSDFNSIENRLKQLSEIEVSYDVLETNYIFDIDKSFK